jgi:hypothetical protein
MLHFIQSRQATNHGQERQYSDRDNCEHKDFISIHVSIVSTQETQMDVTRRLLSISVESEVAGHEILHDTCN